MFMFLLCVGGVSLALAIHFSFLVVINLVVVFHKDFELKSDRSVFYMPGLTQSRIAAVCWGVFYVCYVLRVD